MKASEFKKLIREEVRKVVKEEDYKPSYAHMKPFKLDIAKVMRELQDLNKKIEQQGPLSEEIVDAMESLGELISKINIQTAKG